jgi:hypothetical protein
LEKIMSLDHTFRAFIGGATLAFSTMLPAVGNAELSSNPQATTGIGSMVPNIGGCASTRYGCQGQVTRGFGLIPSTGSGIGDAAIDAATGGAYGLARGFNLQTPYGNVGMRSPFGGFGLIPSTGSGIGDAAIDAATGGAYGLARGFNLQGQQNQAVQTRNNQQPSGIYCAFGAETLLASSIDSCENAGGQVNPAQMTYNVKCSLSDGIVMAPSGAACTRINGKVAQ